MLPLITKYFGGFAMGMREYETIFITRSELSDDIVDRVSAKVEKAIDELSGVLLVKENWGRKKLAYDIQKQAKGCFFVLSLLRSRQSCFRNRAFIKNRRDGPSLYDCEIR